MAIAAITSCTTTSNPSALITAGVLASNARRAGLRVPSWVKTSFTPGSPVVPAYLARIGLLAPLEELGFAVAGFGCATCAGGSGDLLPEAAAVAGKVELAAVLSGNRNFQGRIHPQCGSAYLASPALVVAYAIAGSVAVDLEEAVAVGTDGALVRILDLWPERSQVEALATWALVPDEVSSAYRQVTSGPPGWGTADAARDGIGVLPLGRGVHLGPPPAVRHPAAGRRPDQGGRRPPAPGRRRHHRPHQPGRGDPSGQRRRALAPRPRRAAATSSGPTGPGGPTTRSWCAGPLPTPGSSTSAGLAGPAGWCRTRSPASSRRWSRWPSGRRGAACPLVVLAGHRYGAGSSAGLGRQGHRACWGCERWWPRASSASTDRTWCGWGSCPSRWTAGPPAPVAGGWSVTVEGPVDRPGAAVDRAVRGPRCERAPPGSGPGGQRPRARCPSGPGASCPSRWRSCWVASPRGGPLSPRGNTAYVARGVARS